MTSQAWLQGLVPGQDAQSSDLITQLSNSDLMSILSAREYPVPQNAGSVNHGSNLDIFDSLSFGFNVEEETGGYPADPFDGLTMSSHPQQTSTTSPDGQSEDSIEAKAKKSKKRASDEEAPKERRKKQIREAQRAYRLRKESRISHLTNRVAQLEQVIEDMSTSVVTLSDSLLRSGVLAPHANLTQCTRETLEKCLDLAKASNNDENESTATSVLQKTSVSTGEVDHSVQLVRQPQFGVQHLQSLVPQTFNLSTDLKLGSTSEVQCSAFMDQLSMAIAYHGYLTLANPALPQDYVRQKFRFLLPLMGRGQITTYFAAILHARLSENELSSQWSGVPFLQLGGAGTHYAWPPELGPYTRRSRKWVSVPVPVSDFSKDIQQDITGDVFDMQDLECFLMEKQVKLVLDPPVSSEKEEEEEEAQAAQHPQKPVNARKLITEPSASGGRQGSDVLT
ncbi:hypothetical protein QQS21_000366 [Conoideocrella luteorostrata]|uniref:BZIP domain-containing protein n=1 Tax=Conoideocrella luteorostrata TaxID=1105319 RepID=A0AAJ0D1V4_9HYPO|nr:hypothetical protein QQS21_000366 [Conoideocrella luteorostrata]